MKFCWPKICQNPPNIIPKPQYFFDINQKSELSIRLVVFYKFYFILKTLFISYMNSLEVFSIEKRCLSKSFTHFLDDWIQII